MPADGAGEARSVRDELRRMRTVRLHIGRIRSLRDLRSPFPGSG